MKRWAKITIAAAIGVVVLPIVGVIFLFLAWGMEMEGVWPFKPLDRRGVGEISSPLVTLAILRAVE